MTGKNRNSQIEHAAIYIRCSTGDPDKYSLKAQEEILTALAVSRGWSYEVYNEGIVSGLTIAARPMMKKLLRDAEARKFSICLVIEFERLSRSEDLLDWIEIKKTFRDATIKIQTPQQSYDLSQAEDDFVSDLLGILSKREKLKIKERCRRGIEKAKSEGAYLGGYPLMGYRNAQKGKRPEVYEPEAKTVRMIFEMAETMSPYRICQRLNQQGIKTQQGHRWAERRVRRIVNHLAYAGKRELPTGEMVDLKMVPLVTWEQFQKVQLGKKLRLTRVHDTNPRYLLTGILRCPYCGRSVCSWVDKKTRKSGKVYERRYYTCSRKRDDDCPESKLIHMEFIEGLVVRAIKRAIADPVALEIAQSQSAGHDKAKSMKIDLSRWQARLDETKRQKENIVDAVAQGSLTQEDVRDKMRSLNDAITHAQGKVMSLELQLKEIEGKGIGGVDEVVSRFKELFDASDTLRQREQLKALLEKIEMYRDSIDIHFGFPVNPDGTSMVHVPLIKRQKQPKPAEKVIIENTLYLTSGFQ